MSERAAFDVALVTGMSGAGRSTAANALEDLNWFVIDNLPPAMLLEAIDRIRTTSDITKLAVVVDARGGTMFADLMSALEAIEASDVGVRVLFLEASNEALVRRFESSRRPHPLQGKERIIDGLREERRLLSDIRARADVVIDTSTINVHDLRRKVEAAFASDEPLTVNATVMSFGFKHGIPVDADLVGDVRFLPNPYWDVALREQTGLDEPVARAVLSEQPAQDFLTTYTQLIGIIRDGYLREGKRYVTIALGCTGGRHRSVAMAEALAVSLRESGMQTLVVHRDVGKE
jgi:RNase adapter protein RapZ